MNTEDFTGRSDNDLLALHLSGDEHAFGEVFRRHKDRMWAVALRTTRDPEVASDAVQDGFINAFRRAGSFRGDSQVSTWLYRIVVNACLDRMRRSKPTADIADHDPVEPRDYHRSVEVRIDVRAALEGLPEAQRLALVLVDMQGLSIAEAADVLDCAPGTIKSRCSRGRSALAQVLDPP
ncbi:MAG: RNA polymerase sigma factor SigM [Ornithinimicrobium sp.]